MNSILNTPIHFGSFKLPHRLIQGPLAGYSCAPFRQLFSKYLPPAYAVSEMLSAHDVVYKHTAEGRLLFRSPLEGNLCYQISGIDPLIMAEAAKRLEMLGADLIDINCGCPKLKIRKKGAGSALLEQPQRLKQIIRSVRQSIHIPLTVKIRIQGDRRDIELAKAIEDEGADALIIHGRRWEDDYDQQCDFQQIAQIKKAVSIPVVANGDIVDVKTLNNIMNLTQCDAFMISRAGTGNPWLYQQLLAKEGFVEVDLRQKIQLFMEHLNGVASLESEHQAMLQSKSLVRYYFKDYIDASFLQHFYSLSNFNTIKDVLSYLFLL